MPTINHENIGAAVSHSFVTCTISNINPADDTATVAGGIAADNVPIFYHCSNDAVERENGALEGGSSAFSDNDEIIVMCQCVDGVLTAKKIIGPTGEPRSCGFRFKIIQQGTDEEITGTGVLDEKTKITFTVRNSGKSELFVHQQYVGGYWKIWLGDYSYQDENGYFVTYELDSSYNSIETQYPFRYKTADKWQSEDLIEFGTYEDEVPYWEVGDINTQEESYTEYGVGLFDYGFSQVSPQVIWKVDGVPITDYFGIFINQDLNYINGVCRATSRHEPGAVFFVQPGAVMNGFRRNVRSSIPYSVRYQAEMNDHWGGLKETSYYISETQIPDPPPDPLPIIYTAVNTIWTFTEGPTANMYNDTRSINEDEGEWVEAGADVVDNFEENYDTGGHEHYIEKKAITDAYVPGPPGLAGPGRGGMTGLSISSVSITAQYQ